MGQERRDGLQTHLIARESAPIHTHRFEPEIGAPGYLPRKIVARVELIREPVQFIFARIAVAEGKPGTILTSGLDAHEGEVIRQAVWIEQALLGLGIETRRVPAALPQPQRRQVHGACRDLSQDPGRVRFEPDAHVIHHTPRFRISSGGTMLAWASFAARSASPAQRLSTSSRWDSQISRASTSRFESAM